MALIRNGFAVLVLLESLCVQNIVHFVINVWPVLTTTARGSPTVWALSIINTSFGILFHSFWLSFGFFTAHIYVRNGFKS